MADMESGLKGWELEAPGGDTVVGVTGVEMFQELPGSEDKRMGLALGVEDRKAQATKGGRNQPW